MDCVAFAVGELGLRLHDFYDMPWYEFLLKKYAYYRQRNHQEKENWYTTRFIAHRIAINQHTKPDPSWFGNGGLNRFLPIDEQKPVKAVSEAAKEAFLQEHAEYLRIKEEKK